MMSTESAPATIALIPDGNRRWARAHRMSIFDGYNLGVNKFIEFSEWCKNYGVNSVTVWALSSENLSRPREEVNTLFSIYKKVANDKKILERLHKNKTRVRIIANRDIMPKDLIASLHKIEAETSRYGERVINMLLGYGGKDDILHAAKKAAINFKRKGGEHFEKIFEQSLLSYNIPNIDLIIRTSGEQRLSGFMPWQSAYSELYFSKKLWPDFTKDDLRLAINDYGKRQRRFGR
jgi:undecaprenyl diphosphate synthase